MLVQLTAQAFYYLTGTLFLLYILHKGLFSKWINEKHSLWLAFSFIAMDTFRLESIVAKPDYWLAVLLCLIIVCLYEVLNRRNSVRIDCFFGKLFCCLPGSVLSIKPTSILFLLPFRYWYFVLWSTLRYHGDPCHFGELLLGLATGFRSFELCQKSIHLR